MMIRAPVSPTGKEIVQWHTFHFHDTRHTFASHFTQRGKIARVGRNYLIPR
jgi:integrase